MVSCVHARTDSAPSQQCVLIDLAAHLSKPEAVCMVGTGGRPVAETAVGLDAVSLPVVSSGVAAGATAAAGATMGPPLAASAAAVFC